VRRLALTWAGLLGLLLGLGWLLTRASIGHPFEEADRALAEWLVDHRTAALDRLSGALSALGNTTVVLVLAVLAALAGVALHRTWRPALLLAVALGGELTVFLITTALIDRPRPPVPHLDATLPPTSSFPSGHTAAALCLYGSLAALVLAGTRGRWRGPVVTSAAVVVLLVAGSRLYRGAHYLSDVVASVLFAGFWLFVCLRTLPLRSRTSQTGGRVGP
jgi:undecaprenyl-diphosphatase